MTKVKTTISYIILIVASFLSAFPLYYMICGATNSSIDIVRGKLFPGTYLMENYQSLIANQNLGRAMFNSFRNAIVITVIALLVCSIAGYGFEIYHDKGKDLLMSILLLAMMLPFVAIMIPLFKLFSSWKLVNTWIALALPSISTPFLIMMFRQAARSFPHDIIEASRLEGLSEIKIFFTMFLPIMKSTYGAAMTVTFMNAWNNYLAHYYFTGQQSGYHANVGCKLKKEWLQRRLWYVNAGCIDLYPSYRSYLSVAYKKVLPMELQEQ